jgi:phage terminase Nu1 subunit (DNA packaging protein)
VSKKHKNAANSGTECIRGASSSGSAKLRPHPARASRLPPQGAQPESASSIRELARAVGRSHTVVQRWVQHAEWDQSASPPWNVAQAATWAARTLAPDPARPWREPAPGDATNGHDGGLDALRRNPLNAARLKLALTRAQMLELQRAILAAELVPRKDVEQALVRRVHAVKSAFMALPRQMAGQLVGCNENQIETALDDAIRAVLLELSQQIELPEPPLLETAT